MTADSGAFAAGLDAFANRLYYKTTDDFFRSIKNCELISNSDFSNSDPARKIKEETYQNFKERIDVLRQERVKKLINLKSTISNGPVNELFLQYKSTSFSDEGIFHRIILKIIHKQWKEK